MASRLQDVILRGLAADQPAATDVAPGTLYYSSDTAVTERSNGSAWEDYSDSVSGGVPGLHAPTHASGGTDPVTLAQSQITNLTTDLAGKAASVHALSHASAGSDPLNITSLAGYPGGSTLFLREDHTFAAIPSSPTRYGVIGMVIDGGASVITTGVKGFIQIPFACTLLEWTLLSSDASVTAGSIIVDIWKDVYANYPPVVGDTITAAAKPTLSAVNKNTSSTLTGWTTSITAGDVLGFKVDSITTLTKVTLTLKIQMV